MRSFISVCLILVSISLTICTESENQAKENSVLVHFMDLKRNEFLDALPKLKDAIASSLNDYCSSEPVDCGSRKINFTADNIGFYGNNDKEKFIEDGRFMLTHLFLEKNKNNLNPEGEEEDKKKDSIFPKSFVHDFLKKQRNNIVKDSQVEVAYIENELVYPPRNNLDNYIIISVSCAFCVLLILINLICQRKLSKLEKEQFLNKAKELKPLLTNKNELIVEKKTPSIHSDISEPKPVKPVALSRHDSFDQKLDLKTNATKTRKKHIKNSSSIIAGNLGSGVGSPRDLADERWDYEQSEPEKRNLIKEYSDPKVGYRLASS